MPRRSTLLCSLVLLLATAVALPLLFAQPPQPERALAPFGEVKAKELQKAWAEHLGRKVVEEADLGGGVTMEFVLVPPGTFTMGSPQDEKDHEDDEGPQHEVEITKPFYLGKTAVTQEQYKAVTGSNPSYFSAGGGGAKGVAGQDTARFPVERVSWEDAVAFCRKLSERGRGRRYGLPTEAEWEYACRAGSTTPFSFGDALNGDKAHCNFPYGTDQKGPYLERTCRVGSYPANAWGLVDMHGNVYQWCQDWYGGHYYDKREKRDPQGSDAGDARVLRGGSWLNQPRYCRSAYRGWDVPADRSSRVGFRVAFRLD